MSSLERNADEILGARWRLTADQFNLPAVVTVEHDGPPWIVKFDDPYIASQVVAAHNEALAEQERSFAGDLRRAINRWSMEDASNTPDFLLAEYMERALAAAEILIGRRDRWYGVDPKPGGVDAIVDAPVTKDAAD